MLHNNELLEDDTREESLETGKEDTGVPHEESTQLEQNVHPYPPVQPTAMTGQQIECLQVMEPDNPTDYDTVKMETEIEETGH
jgi:hypothetical protein